MKNKVSCIGRDVIHNFFSRRLIVVCVFQFTILHYYVNSVKQYAAAAGYPAAPWILPFMGQNVYFQFVYGISAVYFYSNVPFLQRYEMYVLMRQGRMRWTSAKLIRIWISAVMFATVTVILSILPLIPHLEWTFQWGKVYNTLALTGTVLVALSVCVGRTAALFIGTFFAVLWVVFANLYIWQEWIGFLSPFSWIDLLLLYGKVCRPALSFAMICIMAVVLGIILYILSLKAVQTKDLDWIEEE